MNTKRTLANFYRQWTDSVNILSYKRRIVDVEFVENRAFETGTFVMKYLIDTVPGEYSGKYMLVWKQQESTYQVEAESFCSDYYLPSDSVPYGSVPVAFVAPSYRLNERDDLENEIRELNEELTRNVASGNGRGRADGYHQNAIYMPNFSKMLVGLDSIRPYLYDTYYPGSNLYADQTFFDVRPINDDNVLIIGHFKGGWERPNDKGIFEGNMINWRKRRKDGKLVMYRQIVNSDRYSTVEVEQQIRERSTRRTEYEQNDDLENFTANYTERTISMPEYQPTLTGVDQIRTFYREIFRRQDVQAYTKSISEFIHLDSTIIEIGTFRKVYTDLTIDTTLTQSGKYWNIWSRQSGGQLKLQGETFGFFHPVAHPNALVVPSAINQSASEAYSDQEVPLELRAYNALDEKAVRTRDGVLIPRFYTDDAQYMPFADSTKTGMAELKAHFMRYGKQSS